MSEFLAEARILVRPDTTKFRAELEAALATATKPITIPVVPVVAGGLATATAGTEAFTVAQAGAAAETQAVAAALEKETIAATQATAAQTAHSRSVAGVARGAGASALTLFGLRGATLAASGAFLAGTAAVVGFSKAIQSAAQFETELNVFRATTGALADEMERVSATAKQLGRDITLPGVTASDAAQAMTELAKAGLSVRDSLEAARGTLQLATAAQISNAEAAKLVSGALNSFELSGSQAVKVADLFAGAAANAQGSIQDFAPALGQASAVAHAFGLSIGDTVTLLTQLAKAGLAGGRAGTSLRVALLRLVKPPDDAAKALKELNIQIRDANGNLRPQVFTDIEAALQGVSKAQRQATEATIFGSDAVRTQILLGQQGAKAFEDIRAAVTASGLAQEQASARTQGLQGDFENLSNQVSSLGLTLGEVATGPTSAFVRSLASVVEEINLTADGAVALVGKMKDVGDAFVGVIPFADRLGSSLGLLKTAAEASNPLTLTLKLASEAAKKFGVDAQTAGNKTSVFTSIAKSATSSLNELADAFTGAAARLRQQQPQTDTGLNVKQIQNIIGGFDAEQVRAQIKGDNAKLLDVLNTEQDFLEKQLQRDFVKRRPALKRAIEQALLGTVNDIASVQAKASAQAESLRRQAEKAAADAAAAVRAREQALLSSQGVARDQQQNKVAQAAQTKGLQDDISQEKKLRALVLAQIAAVKERISIEGGRKAAIVALQAVLTQVNGQLQSLAQQQQAAAEAQRQALLQGIDLDVQFAQLTGNQAAEVKARNRKIAELNRELAAEAKAHGKTTVAYKTIRNQIAEETKALNDITAEKRKQGQSFAQASFDFLQAQQGFASNLLGNLIPTGATGGLVGGGTPVQSALTPAAGLADGQAKSGPTAGQAQTTNSILVRILEQLKQLNGDNSAPEAQRQNRGQRAVMDGVGGG